MAEGHHVLELGAGSGAITKHIMKERNKLASYTGVEIDPNLVDYLKASFTGEKFLAASAEDLKDHVADQSIDVVMCSLPWTLFPQKLQESITKEIVRMLKPGGYFTTFLCVHALAYPGAPRVKKIFNHFFSDFEKKAFIPHNIPPANVYRGTKPLSLIKVEA